jgi:NADH:ubiquinone oxidoreductase subunit 5 (subunit L)/multisubunit Na+/H+ antiporter MnhA subunit
MTINTLLPLFIWVPIVGFLVSLILPKNNERLISGIAFLTMTIQWITATIYVADWILTGANTFQVKEIILFQNEDYIFQIDFLFDKITAVYLLVGALLTFMVTMYSRTYLHREAGYKRFFNTTLFFYLGYSITTLSGNLETLFVGWEILGISSFLLISFYRERFLPVKNAVKVFSIYRIGDVGLILAMWASHHLWGQNITFYQLNNAELVHEQLQQHSFIGVFISAMILLSAAAKSAQLPFSSWLPRAMEGPTPSSAIFYGSLSVHIGAFLLLRTFPFWEYQSSVRIIIIALGLLTTLIATGIARVQSSVKSQIAYASIAQIGIIFIEISLGYESLALFHFAGNAFLRTYQLLVSPSVVSYLIREQFYSFEPRAKTIEDSLSKRLQHSIYVLCLKEWNLDTMMYAYFWNPLKWAGNKLNFINGRRLMLFFIPAFALGFYAMKQTHLFPENLQEATPVVFAFLGLILVLKSFTQRHSVRLAWILVIMNHCWIALAISFNEKFDPVENVLYLSGILIAGLIGYITLQRLFRIEGKISLGRFQGLSETHPKIALIFLLACLGLTGFPITPAFIGEDLIFSHIHEDQFALAAIVSLSFILDGLAVIRIYARVFMGPNSKTHAEFSNRYF